MLTKRDNKRSRLEIKEVENSDNEDEVEDKDKAGYDEVNENNFESN
jgi:hypothetical protein